MNDLNKEILEWSKQFETYHLPRWSELPEIDYYMDQVIEYINGYVSVFSEDNSNLLTSTMINNYVKNGLISPPIKKKYSKKHIATLIVITIMKQVCIISQIKDAIIIQKKLDGEKEAYNLFCAEIEKSIVGIYSVVRDEKIKVDEDVTLENMAVKSISQALANKILATKVVEITKI